MNSLSVEWTVVRRLLTYFYPYRKMAIAALLLLIFSKGVEAWVPIQIGHLVQSILFQSANPGSEEARFIPFLQQGLFILGWIFACYLLDTINIYLKNRVGQKALLTLRNDVYQHILKLPVGYFDRQPIGRLMTRTIHDVDQINQLFAESLIPIFGSLFLFLSIFVAVFIINWKIGCVVLGILPLAWKLTRHFRYYQRIGYQSLRSILSSMNVFMQEHLMGIAIIRNFNLHQQQQKSFNKLNHDYFEANIETIHHFAFFFAGIEWIQNVSMALVFVVLVQFPTSGEEFQAGTFFTMSLYALMVFRPLADLAERYNVLQSAMAAAEKIFEVLDTSTEKPGPQPGRPLASIESIEFKEVWFAYEEEHWVLKGLTFKVEKGDSIALVGMTGSGKTTVLSLLLRFYEFQKGSILINGYPIDDFAVADLRKEFSVILQDPVIFAGSVEENIAFYDSKVSLEKVKKSAQFINLAPMVDRLPHGYHQILKERGIGLSTGEMQLIAMARAVAHERSVLICDEATSNIDIETEKIIQSSLKRLLKDTTSIVIAHRLTTIQDVKRIFVLAQGRVVEEGSHEELLKKKGVYENVYRLQFTS